MSMQRPATGRLTPRKDNPNASSAIPEAAAAPTASTRKPAWDRPFRRPLRRRIYGAGSHGTGSGGRGGLRRGPGQPGDEILERVGRIGRGADRGREPRDRARWGGGGWGVG